MTDVSVAEDRSLTEQVVLLAVARAERDGATPLQTHELRRICDEELSGVETAVAGTVTEADVMRSLYQLEDAALVEEVEAEQTSPTGKGRRAYALGVDSDDVVESVDDRLVADGS